MNWKIMISGLVFVPILAVFAIFLRPESIKRPLICPVHVLLHADGAVGVGDLLFPHGDKLKTWLVSYKKKNPDCFLSVVSDAGVQPASIERVAHTMHEAGFSSVGFITEPHALSH